MHDKGRMPVQKKKKKVNKSKLFGIINCIKKRISFQYPTKCVGKTSPKVWYKKQNQNNFSLFFYRIHIRAGARVQSSRALETALPDICSLL